MWRETGNDPVAEEVDDLASDDEEEEHPHPFIESEATEISEDDRVDAEMADWPSDEDLNYV